MIIEKLNLNRLRKSDIIWLAKNRCSHKHTYLEHPQCFFTENPSESPLYEKIGIFDIECSNLNADFGYIISYCIKEKNGDILESCVTSQDIKLVKPARKRTKQFDTLARRELNS